MKKVSRILVWLMALLPFSVFSQEAKKVEMADLLHENGKIYVVVGVIAIIFIGIVVYLITIDRRLTKIEKEEK
jgi:CcmD family protein